MRSIFAALVLGVAVSLPIPSRALDTPLCSLGSSGDGTVAKVSDTCCQSVEFKCNAEGHISEAVQDGFRNIVLVVA